MTLFRAHLAFYCRNNLIHEAVGYNIFTLIAFPVTFVLKGVDGQDKPLLAGEADHGRHVGPQLRGVGTTGT
jgi:hypothetical protein